MLLNDIESTTGFASQTGGVHLVLRIGQQLEGKEIAEANEIGDLTI